MTQPRQRPFRARARAVAVLATALLVACSDSADDASGPADVVLHDVTVVNPLRGRTPGATVRIAGDVVTEVTDDGPRPASGALERYAGAFVLPGLIDMHVHQPFGAKHAELFYLAYLAHGVTTVRDTGNFDDTILTSRARIASGEIPGPRVFACGPVIDGEPPFWRGSLVVRDPDEARRAVAAVADAGADCAKAYQGLRSAEILDALYDEAAARGLPVVGHVPFAVPFGEAALDDVQHLTGVAVPPPPGPADPYADGVDVLARSWAAIDDARIAAIAEDSRARGITHTPTLVVWARLAQLADHAAVVGDPSAALLPRLYREVLWNPSHPATMYPGVARESFVELGLVLDRMRHAVGALHAAGVRILAGSDTLNPFVVPGAGLHEELGHLVASGLTPEEAWAAATSVAAEALGASTLGIVAPGASADLLVFREDPTSDLAALDSLEAVIVRGRVLVRDDLVASVRRRRAEIDGAVAGEVPAVRSSACH